jgi:hypothetical protein
MLNPDAKMGGGKSSRRRPPSIDGSGVPTNGSGRPNGSTGPGGGEFKKRGRSKKVGGGVGGGGGMAARNRMAAAAAAAAAAANANQLTDLYPGPPPGVEYPFPPLPPGDIRGRMLDFPSPGGPRMSPPPPPGGMMHGRVPHEFGYHQGQEWNPEYQHCGYYQGK